MSLSLSHVGAVVLVQALLSACGAQNQQVVPELNRKKSEERMGQQQQMFQGMNQTPSEQAGAAHEAGTRPVERPGHEDDN